MSREDNIYYARLAEQGERYEDMIRYMKEVSKVSKTPNKCHLQLTQSLFKSINVINNRKSKSYQMKKGIF